MPLPKHPSSLLSALPIPVRAVFMTGNICDRYCGLCGDKAHTLNGCPNSTFGQRTCAAFWHLRRWSQLIGMELVAFSHLGPFAYAESRKNYQPALTYSDVVSYVRSICSVADPDPFPQGLVRPSVNHQRIVIDVYR